MLSHFIDRFQAQDTDAAGPSAPVPPPVEDDDEDEGLC